MTKQVLVTIREDGKPDRVYEVADDDITFNYQKMGLMAVCYSSIRKVVLFKVKPIEQLDKYFPVPENHPNAEIMGNGFTCSNCGANYDYGFNYCPDCGKCHHEPIEQPVGKN